MDRVIIYTTRRCPYCHAAKQYLASRGVPFIERDVEMDPSAAEEMVRLSGQQGVPVIRIGDEIIIGFDRPRLDAALQRLRPRLGAAIADAAKLAAQGRTSQQTGAYIGRVHANSPAAKAGLRPGDVIVALAGQPIKTATDLERLIAALKPGSRVPIEYIRDGLIQRSELVF